MKFVIVGFGRVGMRTARILREEGHEVVIIDEDAQKVDRARSDGYVAYVGDGADEQVLEQAGLGSADAIGGLTGDLNANFAACMIGNHHGCRTVIRIDDDYQEEIYRKYAEDVDEVIYPERLGATGAKTALLGGDVEVIAELTERLHLTTITVNETSPVIGHRIHEIELPDDARIYAHGPEREPMTIPLPSTTVDPGDRVAVIASQDSIDAVRSTLLGEA